MAYRTWQIVQRAADSGRFTDLGEVKAATPAAALAKWQHSQAEPDAFTMKEGAGYLEGAGVVIQAVPVGWLDADTGLPVA